MDDKILARIGAVVFIAGAIAAAAIGMSTRDERPDSLAAPGRPMAAQDLLAAELRRCSAIGEAGPRDPGCLKAWAESRRRFLSQRRPAPAPAPMAPTTLFPNVPAPADPVPNEGERSHVTAPSGQAGSSRPEVP